MKRNIYFLLTALLVAMMSFGLSSCSKDDDNKGGSGDGSSTVMADGKSYNLNRAYYDIWDNGNGLCLEFSNVDYYNKGRYDGYFQYLRLDIERYHRTELESGTYNADVMYFADSAGFTENYKSYNILKQYKLLDGIVPVTIVKNDDTYSISIPETTVNILDPSNERKIIGKTTFSFSYTGKLTQSPDDE